MAWRVKIQEQANEQRNLAGQIFRGGYTQPAQATYDMEIKLIDAWVKSETERQKKAQKQREAFEKQQRERQKKAQKQREAFEKQQREYVKEKMLQDYKQVLLEAIRYTYNILDSTYLYDVIYKDIGNHRIYFGFDERIISKVSNDISKYYSYQYYGCHANNSDYHVKLLVDIVKHDDKITSVIRNVCLKELDRQHIDSYLKDFEKIEKYTDI